MSQERQNPHPLPSATLTSPLPQQSGRGTGESGRGAEPELERFLRLLPHQYPFLLVDRVLQLDGERTVTLKNVTINEPFFTGHFPGLPIMPGVLILEALAQSAAILALSIIGERRSLFMLTGLDKVRFRRRVVPGDQLRMEVRVSKHHHPLWKMHAEARVDGELAAEAELSAMEVEEQLP